MKKLTNINVEANNHELDGLFSNIGSGKDSGFLSKFGSGSDSGFLSKVGTGSEDGFLSKIGTGDDSGFLSKAFTGGNNNSNRSPSGRPRNNTNLPQTTTRQTQPVQTAGISLGNTELVIIGTGLAVLAGITLLNKD